ncbi:MAG: hypothetical protein AAF720_09165 [Pseudomonadota bacterium]
MIKVLLLVLGTLVVAGCSGAKRFLPPGFVKFEDIAKDQPVHPDLEKAIAEAEEKKTENFPLFRDQPNEPPERDGANIVARHLIDIAGKRDTLQELIKSDRTAASAERRGSSNKALIESSTGAEIFSETVNGSKTIENSLGDE